MGRIFGLLYSALLVLILASTGCGESSSKYREASDGHGAILYIDNNVALVKVLDSVSLAKARYVGRPTWDWSTGDSIEETLVDSVDQVLFSENSGGLLLKTEFYRTEFPKYFVYKKGEIYEFSDLQKLVSQFPELQPGDDSNWLSPAEFFERYK